MLTEALEVQVVFWFQRPKGHYGTGKKADCVKASAPVHHTVKPDVDNCVKGLKDGMKGIIYRDDSQVVKLIAEKKYTTQAPFTSVAVREL
jgi:Holliday junction resolvase RusA-like endonuclease